MSKEAISNKQALLAAIDQHWAALTTALDRLTPADFTAHHDDHGWTVKDHLVHLAAWERSVVYLLTGRPRHAGLGVAETLYLSGGEDAINDAITSANQQVSTMAALAELRAVHAELLAVLAPLSDADLQQRYRHYLPDEPGEGDGPPVIGVVYSNSGNHYVEHLPWIAALV
jgi:hypothetical protein